MILLPIVDRELRVASRRRATYSSRVMVALITAVLAVWMMLTLPQFVSTTVAGASLFRTLAWAAVLAALISGTTATADCISSEKRQGTLGLLFLTDLRGYDVVLGKMAATALQVFYGLVAMMPVLAIPILMGGVTAGEFWRIVLALVDLLLFGVASGIFASSISFVERKAVGSAFLIVGFMTLGIPVVAEIIRVSSRSSPLPDLLMQVSPIWASWKGLAANYALGPREYWLSIAITLALSLLMLLVAARAATRVWADRPQRIGQYGWRYKWRRLVRGTVAVQKRFRTSLLDINPILWLASRERHVRLYPWIFLVSTIAVWVWGFGYVGKILRLEGSVVTFYIAHLIFKHWFATATCATLNTDREKASLELLLSTPLRVRDVIAGHWLALRRLFGAPFLTLLGVEILLFPWISATGFVPAEDRLLWTVFGIFGLILLFADCVAIGWLGMWLAIKETTPHRAASSTATVVLVMPWVVLALIRTLTGLLHVSTPLMLWAVLWLVISVAFDLLVSIGARQLLLANLRQSAAERYASKSS